MIINAHKDRAMTEQEKSVYEAKAEVLKALAHPTRLWITEKLRKGPCCVCEFVDQIDADFSTVSRHLSILRQAGVIEDEKRGKQVYYHLKVPCILNFMNCVEAVITARVSSQVEMLHCCEMEAKGGA